MKRQDSLPSMPDTLTGDAADRWRDIFPMLATMRILQPCDGPALARLCRLYADERAVRLEIETASDPKRSDSLRRILAKTTDQLRALESGFGLSPSVRTRVETVQVTSNEQGEFQRFLQADRVEPDESPTAKYLRSPKTKADFFRRKGTS